MHFSYIVTSVVCYLIITIQIVDSISDKVTSGTPLQDHGTMILLSNDGDEAEKESVEKETMPEDNHTFVVLLDVVQFDGTSRTCTGAVIHDNVVLSAAHCFRGTENDNEPELTASFVVLGTKKQYDTGYEQYLPIEKVIIHPKYKLWTADLALVYTFAGMMSDKPGKVIRMAGEKSSNPVDSNVTVLSWGRCSDRDIPEGDAKDTTKIRTVLKSVDDFRDPRYRFRDDRVRQNDRQLERLRERERDLDSVREKESLRERDSYRDKEREEGRDRAWDIDRKSRVPSPVGAHLSGYEMRRESPKNRFNIMTGVKEDIPVEPSLPKEVAPQQTTLSMSRYLPKSEEILRETQLRVNNAENVDKIVMSVSGHNPQLPERSDFKNAYMRGSDTKLFADSHDRLRTEEEIPKSNDHVMDDPSRNIRQQAVETIIMTHAKSDPPVEKLYTLVHRSRKQFRKRYPMLPQRTREENWRRIYDTQNGPDPEEIEGLLEESKANESTSTHRNEIEDYKVFRNSRRNMGSQKNELTVESFGLVNLQTCKKLIDKAKPANTLENINEVLCFSSEDHYITYEDSGAPVLQNGELVAVTIAGIEVEGEHVAIGMKMTCFCHWIAENLPNHSGNNMKCCKNCCGEKNDDKRYMRQNLGLKTADNSEISNEEYVLKEREILHSLRAQAG